MKHIKNISIPKTVTPPAPVESNTFLNHLYTETSKGLTENEAITFTRSGSALLDFYAQAGAMRKNPEAALDLFQKAFAEHKEASIRILFYLRDIRGGQGERDLFRNCLAWLGTIHPAIFKQIVTFIPEYGRWDDMFFDFPACIETIRTQLIKDTTSVTPSLLAKWMPTINASSPTTRGKARFFADKLELTHIAYRKLIRNIRKTIATVEEKMSANQWPEINYSSVPSQASRIYKNAFKKHDETRYNEFIEQAKTGKAKINAGTLYPYQIYKTTQNNYSETLEALWNQLPDYTRGKNAIVVADVSGSMAGDPMAVSVSLALYFAEKNKGQFKDHFITFSNKPVLQRIQGTTLIDKINSIETANWKMNTDLQAVFDLILNTAIQHNTPIIEMPETIYIISDMEFDQACGTQTNLETIKTKYEQSNYKIPNLVFWNVDARSGKNLPAQKNKQGIALVSGLSPVIFKIAVENKTPEQIMLDTINSERYAPIKIEPQI